MSEQSSAVTEGRAVLLIGAILLVATAVQALFLYWRVPQAWLGDIACCGFALSLLLALRRRPEKVKAADLSVMGALAITFLFCAHYSVLLWLLANPR